MRSWGLLSSNFIIRMHRWKEGSVVLLIILLLCYLLTILDMTQVRNSVKLTPHKVRQICFFFYPTLMEQMADQEMMECLLTVYRRKYETWGGGAVRLHLSFTSH